MSAGAATHSSFRNGVHPAEHKEETAALQSRRMPFVERYTLPLSQHIGAPAKALVSKGETVRRGQLIAEAGGFVSSPLHAPVEGVVTSLEASPHPAGRVQPAIVIEADPFSQQRIEAHPIVDPARLEAGAWVKHVQAGGLVGMGGAAFPTHVKYALKEGQRVRYLVINGCECEPYLTCDHRTMLEESHAVIRGVRIAAAHLGVEKSIIGVEANKADAAAALQEIVADDPGIEVKTLQVKYPQGAEKMLIKAIFGVDVPPGKLPLDLDMVVNNVGTMAALANWFDRGIPLIERTMTLAGPGVRRPANLVVPVGTPVSQVLAHVGGLTEETRCVVMGGPMMGMPISSLDVPVLKGTSGILALTERESWLPTEHPCVRCGRCLEACPYFLNPSRLARLGRNQRWEEMSQLYAMDCMECGACSYACPSGIPIVQLIRVGKQEIRALGSKS